MIQEANYCDADLLAKYRFGAIVQIHRERDVRTWTSIKTFSCDNLTDVKNLIKGTAKNLNGCMLVMTTIDGYRDVVYSRNSIGVETLNRL